MWLGSELFILEDEPRELVPPVLVCRVPWSIENLDFQSNVTVSSHKGPLYRDISSSRVGLRLCSETNCSIPRLYLQVAIAILESKTQVYIGMESARQALEY